MNGSKTIKRTTLTRGVWAALFTVSFAWFLSVQTVYTYLFVDALHVETVAEHRAAVIAFLEGIFGVPAFMIEWRYQAALESLQAIHWSSATTWVLAVAMAPFHLCAGAYIIVEIYLPLLEAFTPHPRGEADGE